MITPTDLARGFAVNLDTAKQQAEGLSHADTILQPPGTGNCMNWVLGHVASSRNGVLELLGRPPVLGAEHAKRYGYGSEPVCADGEDIMRLDEILEALEAGQRALDEALAGVAPEELDREVESFLGTSTLGYLLLFLFRHETYHLGETELLRQLALVNAGA